MADVIKLTDEAVRIAAAGANVNQDLRLALDVENYDELDLLLVVYETNGSNIVVTILTGMSNESEAGWVTAGAFAGTNAAGANKLNLTSFLRYIRYQLTTSGTFNASFAIDGMARRWSPRDLVPNRAKPTPRELEPAGPRAPWRPDTTSQPGSATTIGPAPARGTPTAADRPDRSGRPT